VHLHQVKDGLPRGHTESAVRSGMLALLDDSPAGRRGRTDADLHVAIPGVLLIRRSLFAAGLADGPGKLRLVVMRCGGVRVVDRVGFAGKLLEENDPWCIGDRSRVGVLFGTLDGSVVEVDLEGLGVDVA
jgi:hypothetical protein